MVVFDPENQENFKNQVKLHKKSLKSKNLSTYLSISTKRQWTGKACITQTGMVPCRNLGRKIDCESKHAAEAWRR
jgi:hypothetical protein